MGDKGNYGVDKQYLVRWKGDYEDTWELEENLECADLVQKYHRTKGRTVVAPVNVMSVSAPEPQTLPRKPWSMTIRMDISKATPSIMTQQVCNIAGISMEQIALQTAFVPCESYTYTGFSNFTRNNHFRDHSKPDKPPRPDSCEKRDIALSRFITYCRHGCMIKKLYT